MPVKTFTDNTALPASDINTFLANSGLVYITQASLNAVTNNISNVFSADYDAYRVTISNMNNGSATTRVVTIRFRTTTDDTSANYSHSQYGFYGTTPFSSGAAGVTAAEIMSISSGGNNGGSLTMDIVNPYLAKLTTAVGQTVSYQGNVTAHVFRHIGFSMNTTTQYTGFSIIGTTDALSGTVRVYGYRQA